MKGVGDGRTTHNDNLSKRKWQEGPRVVKSLRYTCVAGDRVWTAGMVCKGAQSTQNTTGGGLPLPSPHTQRLFKLY